MKVQLMKKNAVPNLEKGTEAFIKEVSAQGGKPLYKLTPNEARAVLEKVQSGPVKKLAVKIEDRKIPTGQKNEVSIRIIRPENGHEPLPVIMFFHGAGWILGSAATHDRLARELAVGSHAAVVFVNYSRSPEAKFPTAVEEAFAATKYVAEHGKELNLDTSHLAVFGDSVGGNMAIAVTLLAKERHGPKIDYQVLFYPVTSSALDTPSYQQFAEGPWLTKPAMEWFWHAYEPNAAKRKQYHLSPLNASLEQLKNLPPALIVTAENDVLRDEGEEYASKLMHAGVNVTALRCLGTIHDFAMLNALASTPAARLAISVATTHLHQALSQAKKLKPSKRAA
jgi:acetyl esterase